MSDFDAERYAALATRLGIPPAHLLAAFEHFARRERRFGKTSAQVAAKADA